MRGRQRKHGFVFGKIATVIFATSKPTPAALRLSPLAYG